MNGSQWKLTTLAGHREGFLDGSFLEARMTMPYSLALAPGGDLYFADRSNKCIRKLEMSSGKVVTVAKTDLNSPTGLTWTNLGYFLVCDRSTHKVYKMDLDGTLQAITGQQSGCVDGAFEDAKFDSPCAASVGADGTIYISDSVNDRIRGLNMGARTVSTLTGSRGGHLDGPLETALFFRPWDICASPYHELFVCDWGNNHIRLIDLTQRMVRTITRKEGKSSLDCPIGLVMTPQSDLIVADRNNHCLRVLTRPDKSGTTPSSSASASTAEWEMTTFAGSKPGFTSGICATEAQLVHPTALEFDTDGSLFIASNSCIRVAKQLEEDAGSKKKLSSLSTSIGVLLENANFADFTFESVSGRQWQLHKVILFYRCPSFAQDSVLNELRQLRIADEAWQSFFDYIYLDRFSEPILEASEASRDILRTLWTEVSLIAKTAREQVVEAFCRQKAQSINIASSSLQSPPTADNSGTKMDVSESSVALESIAHMKHAQKAENRQFTLQGGKLFSQLGHACSFHPSGDFSSQYGVIFDKKSPLVPFDYTVRVGGQLDIPVHKTVIWARWPYFRFMMDSGMAEANSGVLELGTREQSGLEIEAWIALLYFFYSDSPALFKPHTALQLLSFTDMYRITSLDVETGGTDPSAKNADLKALPGFEHLLDTCKLLIDGMPTVDGAISLHRLALEYGNAQVLERTKRTIVANLPSIFRDEKLKSRFEELPVEEKYGLLEEAFGKFIRSSPK